MIPELQNLKESFSECLLNDSISTSDIYETLLKAIEEDKKYFTSQVDRINRMKNLISAAQQPYDLYEQLTKKNRY